MSQLWREKLVSAVFPIILAVLLSGCAAGDKTKADTTPPTVSSTNPANNATGIAVNSTISATFSETMLSTSISSASFTLNNGVTGTVTYNGTTATFTPLSNLAGSTTYTATITNVVKDAAGNAMTANKTWAFTTGTATDTWTSKTSMPAARWGAGGGVVNGKLYVAGGQNSGGSLDTLVVYDPVTDNWNTKTPMPTVRSSVGGAVINGKLYVVGGNSAANQKLATLEVYDPAANTWTTKAAMPTARSGPGVVAINGLLYVAGGCMGWCAPVTNALEVYDPANDAWTTKASIPTGRGNADVVAANNLFYVMGGCCGWTASESDLMSKTIEFYNPATNIWTSGASHAVGTGDLAGVINGKIYVAKSTVTDVYDPATDTWASAAPMTVARQYAAGGVVNGKLYVAGGYDGIAGVASLEALSAAITPYSSDANTVLLDHLDGATSASILAYSETGAACGTAKPSAAPNATYVAGLNGLSQALSLNPPVGQPAGSGTYLQYPGGQLLSQSNGTIEFWTYLTTYGTGVGLVNQGPFPGSCAGWTYHLGVNASGQLRSAAWAAFDVNSGITTVPLNTWTHVAASWGSTGARLYINGVLVGSDVNTGMPASGYGGSVLVDYSSVGLQIDELRISNMQRTSF